jgi:hypothetical protein
MYTQCALRSGISAEALFAELRKWLILPLVVRLEPRARREVNALAATSGSPFHRQPYGRATCQVLRFRPSPPTAPSFSSA